MNKSEDKTLETLATRITELEQERKSIDEKLGALNIAYEAISGTKHKVRVKRVVETTTSEEKPTAPKPRKRRSPEKPRRLDKKANEKTLAFIKSRKRPVEPHAVASFFRITDAAAIQRLLTLTDQGELVRVSRGKYLDKERGKLVVHKHLPQVNGVASAEAS